MAWNQPTSASGGAGILGTPVDPVSPGGSLIDLATETIGALDHGAQSGLLDDDHTQYQLRTEENAASGYAGLDGSAKLADPQVAASNVTQHEAAIDHDALTNFDIGKHREINDAGTSTIETWSANKIDAEVSALLAGKDVKPGVDTSTEGLGNITLSGEQTLNGLLTSASRVMVTDQTDPIANGIYVSAAGGWSRAPDADEDAEVTNGNLTHVLNSGSTKFKYKYLLVTPDIITVGTTPQTWEEHKDIDFGTTGGTATEGNDTRVPTQDENNALAGVGGAPTASNKYVTEGGRLLNKAGVKLNASFSGNPKKATVTFSTAFADANYSPALVAETTGPQFAPSVESIAAGTFVINIGANNINGLTAVRWTATKHGEVA